MNKIYPILVSILILVGCNNSAQHAALVQVETLMTRNLDSAYISLRMIDPRQLSQEDKAYYSLLQTTVQYKKCIPIPNDSIINIAIEYYTNHFDQNKLTRALMYKGAVLADLNSKKLALACYKEAEKVADSTDFMTMGLLNFRMGELYQKSYIKNDEHIKRYKLSLQYFKQAKHDIFENDARIIIGQLYSNRNYDSAYLYLNKALSVAQELDNKQQIVNCSFILSNFYDYHNANLEKAKDLALVVYQNRDSIAVGNDIYSHLAILYSKLDILDSANYFYRQCPMPLSAIDSMRYHIMQEEIAIAHNDYKTAYSNRKRATKIADFIVKQGKSEEYYAIDKEFDNHVANSKVEQLTIQRKLHLSLIIIISLSFLIVILIGVYIWRRKKRIFTQNQQLVDQLQTDILNQQSLTQDILEKNVLSISNLNKTIYEKESLENSLKEIVTDRMLVLRNIMNIKYQFGDKPEKFIQQFDKIIAVNKKSPKECDSIIRIANQLYDNIIDYINNEHYGLLSYGDKLMLSLVCLEFSPIEMTVFLNCPNTTAMYSQRYRLGKKLKTSSLEVYIANVKMALFMAKKLEKSAQKQQS